jgi:hypothetical protein
MFAERVGHAKPFHEITFENWKLLFSGYAISRSGFPN